MVTLPPPSHTHTLTADSSILIVTTVVYKVTVVRTVCEVGLQATAVHVVEDDRAHSFSVPCILVCYCTATRVTKLTTYHLNV